MDIIILGPLGDKGKEQVTETVKELEWKLLGEKGRTSSRETGSQFLLCYQSTTAATEDSQMNGCGWVPQKPAVLPDPQAAWWAPLSLFPHP